MDRCRKSVLSCHGPSTNDGVVSSSVLWPSFCLFLFWLFVNPFCPPSCHQLKGKSKVNKISNRFREILISTSIWTFCARTSSLLAVAYWVKERCTSCFLLTALLDLGETCSFIQSRSNHILISAKRSLGKASDRRVNVCWHALKESPIFFSCQYSRASWDGLRGTESNDFHSEGKSYSLPI